jgi:hypothetical protein
MLHIHESLGGAFPKRHHVDCGVKRYHLQGADFGALQRGSNKSGKECDGDEQEPDDSPWARQQRFAGNAPQ